MPSALMQKSAASPARVQFDVILNHAIEKSLPSADDYSWAQSDHGDHPDDPFPWHKPSVFYFRRELRRARDLDRARCVTNVVFHEFGKLAAWAEEQQLKPMPGTSAVLCAGVLGWVSVNKAIDRGLEITASLERLQAHVSNQGLIPPKWLATDEEANDKGWTDGDPADDETEVRHG